MMKTFQIDSVFHQQHLKCFSDLIQLFETYNLHESRKYLENLWKNHLHQYYFSSKLYKKEGNPNKKNDLLKQFLRVLTMQYIL